MKALTIPIRKWKIFIYLFIGGLLVLGNLADDELDPCKKNGHLTDIEFTCCAGVRYKSPEMYRKKEYIDSCLKRSEKGGIVKTAWAAFKCMIEKALGSFDASKMPSHLAKEFPSDIKTSIEEQFKTFIARDPGPYTGNSHLEGFEDIANAWNAYYTAENTVCLNHGKSSQLQRNDDNHCYSWIEQTTRRGDCCRRVPIPFEIYPDPLVLQYFALKNYTAVNLMGLVGEFDWHNVTIVQYSDNVANCRRMALFILQGKTTLEKLKTDIFAQTPPNYKEITDYIIPPFMSKEVADQIKDIMYNDTEIKGEYGTRNMLDKKTSIYQYIYADDWVGNTYDQNATRYLFWHCHANFLLSSRYKAVDMSEYCWM